MSVCSLHNSGNSMLILRMKYINGTVDLFDSRIDWNIYNVYSFELLYNPRSTSLLRSFLLLQLITIRGFLSAFQRDI
jgi:hypothetical protein